MICHIHREINGFSICYKVGPVPKNGSKTKTEEQVLASPTSEGCFP